MKMQNMEAAEAKGRPILPRLLTLARAHGLWPQQKPIYTEEQRQFNLNEALKEVQIVNIDIWLLLAHANRRRKNIGGIFLYERDRIIEEYVRFRDDLEEPNPPVARLVNSVINSGDITGLSIHPLHRYLLFNYDQTDHEDPNLTSLKNRTGSEFLSLEYNYNDIYYRPVFIETFDSRTQRNQTVFKAESSFSDDYKFFERSIERVAGLLKAHEYIKAGFLSPGFRFGAQPLIIEGR